MSMKQWLGQIDHTARYYESQSKQQSITMYHKIPVDIAITLFLTEIINFQFSFNDST